MIKTANKNVEDYTYFNRYDKDQNNAYLNSKINGNLFTLELPVGDCTILQELPGPNKDIPAKDLPKMQKVTTFNPKRKRIYFRDENAAPNSPTLTPEPRLEQDITELDQKFTLFVRKLQEGLQFSIIGRRPNFCNRLHKMWQTGQNWP